MKAMLVSALAAIAANSAAADDWAKLDGSLKQISFDGYTLCGVNSGDEIYCATEIIDMKSPTWQKMDGSLKQVVVLNNRVLGVNLKDDIWGGNVDPHPSWVQWSGSLKQISTDGKQVCGSNKDNEIYCANTDIYTNAPFDNIQSSIKLKQVVVHDGVLFGVNTDGDIYTGLSFMNPVLVNVPGKQLQQVSYDGKWLCGVNSAQEIWCATTDFTSNPNWQHIDGNLTYVDVHDDQLYGVNEKQEIYYKKLTMAQPVLASQF